MPRIKVGSLEIVALLDLVAPFPPGNVFPDLPPSSWGPYRPLYPDAFDGDNLKLSITSYAIAGGGRTAIVDTGLGPQASGQLVSRMRAEGFDPEAVDTVIFTHLHLDHVGWNFKDGKATFPNATYVVQQADWDFFSGQKEDAVVQSQVVPLEKTGALKLVAGETQLTAEITLLPTPGHTPGHQSIVISSGSERALIAGDLGHHPAQVQETAWSPGFDHDGGMAAATRRRIFDELEREGGRGCFGHFPTPGFGLIVKEGGRRIFRAL